MSQFRTVKELMEFLKTVSPETKLLHINYERRGPNKYSIPEVWVNMENTVSIGAERVGDYPEDEDGEK